MWKTAEQRYGILGVSLMKLTEIGEKMANQVVSTYLGDRSFDTTDWWKGNIRSANTIAPDHLLPSDVLNPDNNAIRAQDESTSFYGDIIPIEISEIKIK